MGPYYFDHDANQWFPVIDIEHISYSPGVDVYFEINQAATELAGNTFTFQYSIDFGVTWIDGNTYTAIEVGGGVNVPITETSYRWRLLMNTPHTCQIYSATVTSSEYGFYYAQVDDAIPGFALSGYTINGQAMDSVPASATLY